MKFLKIFLLFSPLSVAFSHETFDSHLLPRPLILEYQENTETQYKELEDEIRLHCASWRFSVEANNVNPWKTIPEECAKYVKDYLTGRAYGFDLERLSKEAGVYAKSVELNGDGKDVWIFDIDDTLLSNLPYYADHGYGLEVFDHVEFDKWVEMAMAPAIKSSLKLYEEVLSLGFKVFLLTGRTEGKRKVTVENLNNAGFQDWHKLILRSADDSRNWQRFTSQRRGVRWKRRDIEYWGIPETSGVIYWVPQSPSAHSSFRILCIRFHDRAGIIRFKTIVPIDANEAVL